MRNANLVLTVGLSALTIYSPLGPAVAQTTRPTAGNSAQTDSDQSLSSKLSKSGGVIAPDASVDPGIKIPAPDPHPNSTPVIPPSATGGNSAK